MHTLPLHKTVHILTLVQYGVRVKIKCLSASRARESAATADSTKSMRMRKRERKSWFNWERRLLTVVDRSCDRRRDVGVVPFHSSVGKILENRKHRVVRVLYTIQHFYDCASFCSIIFLKTLKQRKFLVICVVKLLVFGECVILYWYAIFPPLQRWYFCNTFTVRIHNDFWIQHNGRTQENIQNNLKVSQMYLFYWLCWYTIQIRSGWPVGRSTCLHAPTVGYIIH